MFCALSNQATIDRFSAVRRENEELKLSLDGCIEEKKQLQAKLAKLEQANKSLLGNIASLQEQVRVIISVQVSNQFSIKVMHNSIFFRMIRQGSKVTWS